jgi:diaminohydroxyphosphoribosylaminopyrimidine deaminase/5-amino-6-(5-phosphoribosylamino)uracil reductase
MTGRKTSAAESSGLSACAPGARDLANMRSALALARRGLGNVWPNPAVGCVLVHENDSGENTGGRAGRVVGRGWTQPGGRPHAETEALGRASAAAKGATAYVTLEPCAHHGETPPCADALAAAGVVRVVAAIEDPDPRVAGQGLARLAAAGIEVTRGVGADEAAEINAGFFLRVRAGRPLVTLKLASTLDGRIAAPDGESRWITGEDARARAHVLRAEHDAVMIGSGTALADDPELTCRLPGFAGGRRQPVRVVMDSRLRLPSGAKLARTAAETPTWVVTAEAADPARKRAFAALGVEIVEVPAGPNGHVDAKAALAALGRRGLTRVLVEGGGTLAAALLKADLVDRMAWFHAPAVLGGEGRPAVGALALAALAEMPRFAPVARAVAGADGLVTFRRLGR